MPIRVQNRLDVSCCHIAICNSLSVKWSLWSQNETKTRPNYTQGVMLNNCVSARWSLRSQSPALSHHLKTVTLKHSCEAVRHQTLIVGGFSSHFCTSISALQHFPLAPDLLSSLDFSASHVLTQAC